jgi:hypothetical protein
MGLDNLDQNYYDKSFPGNNHPWKMYRKKPIQVRAIQWNGSNTEDIVRFSGGKANRHTAYEGNTPIETNYLDIHTLEGVMVASIGDFIIEGVQGEFYPCKPDIFEKTYEEVWD